MDLLRNIAIYEANKRKRDAKRYTFVRKEKIGKLERNVFSKQKFDTKTNTFITAEYVKHNGKHMELNNFKTLMKKKNLYTSPSPIKSPVEKSKINCKKDCVSINKECNFKTGRCIIKKNFDGNKECKKNCELINKKCNKQTGRCNKI